MKPAILFAAVLALALPALADGPTPVAPLVVNVGGLDVKLGALAGTVVIVTPADKREAIFARIGAATVIGGALHVGARLDASRTQVGTTAGDVAPATYRDLQAVVAARYDVKDSRCGPAVAAGTTWSIEGNDGPVNPRQYQWGLGGACGSTDGASYVYALVGKDQAAGKDVVPVTGASSLDNVRLFVSLQAHLAGPSYLVAQGVPFGDGAYAFAGVAVAVPDLLGFAKKVAGK